jgi:hypothetical protein
MLVLLRTMLARLYVVWGSAVVAFILLQYPNLSRLREM